MDSNPFIDISQRVLYAQAMIRLLDNCILRLATVTKPNETLTLDEYVHHQREIASLARHVGNVATDYANMSVIELSNLRRTQARKRATLTCIESKAVNE